MTALAPELATTDGDDGDGLTHLWCCDPDTALCGSDLTGDEDLDDDAEVDCIVCLDLEETVCPRCGE
ncbi:hypothetical protein ACIQU5_28025 [Streptomyces sp. NPDC090306]|uniref:hypothetical protein n=1 Tax=Streptomyces sp. NPDC090306 TaxID=3365961 RepID=UPI0038181F82